MQKVLWSGFCGMLLCVPMILSAQTDEAMPVAEPTMIDFASEGMEPTVEPMLLEFEGEGADPSEEPMALEDVVRTGEPMLFEEEEEEEEEAVSMPAMEIEVLDDTVSISNEPSELFSEGAGLRGSAAYFTIENVAQNVVQGEELTIKIVARDVNGDIASNYKGTMRFSSSDPRDTSLIDYTFTDEDQGEHTFYLWTKLHSTGAQTLYALDIIDFRISGELEVFVEPFENASIKRDLAKAAFVEKFATGFVIVMVLILYLGLPALSIGLMICAARKNWATKKKKEASVGYAGFWKRVAIKVFDKLINIAIVPAFFSLYYYFRDGQTIGDKVFGAKIVDKKSHEMASVGKLWMRFIAKIISTVALGVGFWPAGWRKEKNAWHDSLSDTRYISTKKVKGIWIVLTISLLTIAPLAVIAISAFQTYMNLAAQQGVL